MTIKDEMIIRLSVMDVQILDAGVNGETIPIFHLTTPRFLVRCFAVLSPLAIE